MVAVTVMVVALGSLLIIWILVIVLLGASVADNKMVYVVLCEPHAQLA